MYDDFEQFLPTKKLKKKKKKKGVNRSMDFYGHRRGSVPCTQRSERCDRIRGKRELVEDL
jgi:hypothetical protein